MKQFRPYHFPPLHQVRAASGTLAAGGQDAPSQEDRDSALAAGQFPDARRCLPVSGRKSLKSRLYTVNTIV